jgi:signal transduction histidine kinase
LVTERREQLAPGKRVLMNPAVANREASYSGGLTESDFLAAVEAAKLQALYNFAYGLSHEINNPLANISARAQTLLIDEKDPDRRRKLATIVQQAFKAHEMIADLMLFARPPALRPQPIDLVKLADTVVAEMQEQAVEQQTRLIRSGVAGSLMATVDPTQIAVALKALVQNSLEAVKSGGSVEVIAQINHKSQISNVKFDEAHSAVPSPNLKSEIRNLQSREIAVLLTVTDTGPGIPPDVRAHIFDPFFSGREAGRGLGLGLSKAWRIVDLHGGAIAVESRAGQGAQFTIGLPTALPNCQLR